MKIDTTAIHAGMVENEYGAVVEPIYRASTFAFPNVEEGMKKGDRLFAGEDEVYVYARMGNPTTGALERRLAALEHAEACVVTASGIGAITTALWTFLKAGDHVLADTALYGDTNSFIETVLTRFGVQADFIDFHDYDLIKRSLKPNTAIVYFESPGNPTLKINDIAGVSKIVHDYNKNIRVVIDNTFASPYLQNPLTLGANIVVASMSKYLGGHSDVIAGCVCGTRADMSAVRFSGIEKTTGAVLSADYAYLVLRGVASLPVRMEKHCANALAVAKYLEHAPGVAKVRYPGLPSYEGYETAKKQMRLSGGMVSVELDAGFEEAKRFLNSLRLFRLAVSLGGVESLVEHPASMTHSHVSAADRAAAGITDGQIRLSVGIENPEDIIADLDQALKAAVGK
jgi:methionine-gamma-lyase